MFESGFWKQVNSILSYAQIPAEINFPDLPSSKNKCADLRIPVEVQGVFFFFLFFDGEYWYYESPMLINPLIKLNWKFTNDPEIATIRILKELLWNIQIDKPIKLSQVYRPNLLDILEPISKYWLKCLNSENKKIKREALKTITEWTNLAKEFGFYNFPNLIESISLLEKQTPQEAPSSFEKQTTNFRFQPRVAAFNNEPISSYKHNDAWHQIRNKTITATDARRLVKLNGDLRVTANSVISEKSEGQEDFVSHSMMLGIEREPFIAEIITSLFPEYKLQYNNFLFIGENITHAATPDMVGLGVLCEIKVSHKPITELLKIYNDQMQWQMHVTGAERVLFAVENSKKYDLDFQWVERSDSRIDQLIRAAHFVVMQMETKTFISDGFEIMPFSLDMLNLIDMEEIIEEIEQLSLTSFEEEPEEIQEVEVLELPEPQSLEEVSIDSQDTYREWSRLDHLSLLMEFSSNSNLSQLATTFRTSIIDIVSELTKLILKGKEPLVDINAPNFGMGWSSKDYSYLQQLFDKNLDSQEIATLLGRDQLAIGFKAFENNKIRISKKKFKKAFNKLNPFKE